MKQDNLYIIRTFGRDTSLLKFGYSSNIEGRLEQYIGHNPLIEVVGTYYREDAKEFENLFHSHNKAEERREYYSEDMLETIVHAIDNLPLSTYFNADTGKPKKVVYITYRDVAKVFKEQIKLRRSIATTNDDRKKAVAKLDMGVLSTYTEYINLLNNVYVQVGKVLVNHSDAKQALADLYTAKNKFTSVKIAVQNTFNVGHSYTRREVKEKLNKQYSRVGLIRKAKHSDLHEFFECVDKKVMGDRMMVIVNKLNLTKLN